MMRAIVLALLIANLGFFAWTQGWLDAATGMPARGDREPDRLKQQVNPDHIRVLPPAPAASAAAQAAAADTAAQCLEAGPFTTAQFGPAESALQALLPAGSLRVTHTEIPATWAVYMGRFADRAALQKKAEELTRMKLRHEEVRNAPDLEPGLSLGRYDSQEAADRALSEVAQRGVRTARVAQLSPASASHMLRVERADTALQAQLHGLKLDALAGKSFVDCAKPAG